MDNIHLFPDTRSIDEEAATWLARLDADSPLTETEIEQLREWLGRSPRHRQALNSLNKFWGNNVLTELMVPLGREKPVSLLKLLRTQLTSWTGLATATLACAVFIFIAALPSSNPDLGTNGLYVTAVGQQRTLILEDGSEVHLNTDSQLDVQYDSNYRNLRLIQGEAYFEVASNPDKPFRVYAGSGRVQALGTAFNVLLANAGLNVLVTEGTVSLASLGEASLDTHQDLEIEVDPYVQSRSRNLAILNAGQLVNMSFAEDVDSGTQELTAKIDPVAETDLSRVSSWREGYLFFSGEPLEEVVSEISRYTTLSIEVVGADLKQLQIGGRFKAGDIDGLFAALETNFGIEVKRLTYNKIELVEQQAAL